MRDRLIRLIPVGVAYGILLGLCVLGPVLATVDAHAIALWFVFFLAPFSALYCIPFGLGIGILAQQLVWYTATYGHRLVGTSAVIMLIAMLIGWSGSLFSNFDIVYLLAVIWPVFASTVGMLVGMYYVRAEEYEEAARYADGYADEYDDEEYEEYGEHSEYGEAFYTEAEATENSQPEGTADEVA